MNKKTPFWEIIDGKNKISHTKLIEFLQSRGFAKVRLSSAGFEIVRIHNNRLRVSSISDAVECVRLYLTEENKQPEIYELFARSLGTYVSHAKLDLLRTIEKVNDRDDKHSSTFYFQNCYCVVNPSGVTTNSYKNLKNPIWENRILKFDYNDTVKTNGQFEQFFKNITGNVDARFAQLKSAIGYLLHRNKQRESRAVILYDQNMATNNLANGGTGKTLLGKALAKCRETVEFNGKELKRGSFFKNQRINQTTDVLVYDDLQKGSNLEDFFNIITSGIEVEKKGKHAFYLDHSESPKVMISSNYAVGGPGGSSDERRRYEFSITNHYTASRTPEIEFGNRFFDESWSVEEWNLFYKFMMECTRTYLRYGLVFPGEGELSEQKIVSDTNAKFLSFMRDNVKPNTWYDKREIERRYAEFDSENRDMSSHAFAKYLKLYAKNVDGEVQTKSSGGSYSFMINSVMQG